MRASGICPQSFNNNCAASENRKVVHMPPRYYYRNHETTNRRDTSYAFTQQKDNETLQDSGVHDNAIIDCSITKFAVLRALATEISLDESSIPNVRPLAVENATKGQNLFRMVQNNF